MANSKVVIVVAVKPDGTKSGPFKLYLRNGYSDVEGEVTLRMDKAVNRDGNEVVTISNSGVGLIASHSPEYVEESLKGFRRKMGDDMFVVAKMLTLPSVKSLDKAELI
jgi:hypothetical protein